jgi:hypothetical protein
MITYRMTFQGAWELSADVTDPFTPFTWSESMQFFDYTKKEATELFREYLAKNKMTIQKDA